MRPAARNTWRFGLLVAAAPFVLLPCVRACAPDAERIRLHQRSAERWIAAGRPERALAERIQARRLGPDDPETNERLGRAFERRGDLSEALFYLLEAHRLDASRVGAALTAADLLIDVDPGRADQLVEAVLERDPDSARAHMQRSRLRLRRGGAEAAVADARRAVELDPDDGAVQHHLGRVLKMRIHDALRAGRAVDDARFREACTALRRATQLDPGNWVARLERVWVLAVWPGREALAREEAWAAFRATFEAVDPEVLARGADRDMLAVARRIGDESLLRYTREKLGRPGFPATGGDSDDDAGALRISALPAAVGGRASSRSRHP
jgi:tetratricopeptide (TPR) repeat protein